MDRCSLCGKATIHLVCSKCGLVYCSAHRMSSQHNCQGVGGADPRLKMKKLVDRVNESIFWVDKNNTQRLRRD